MPCCSPRGTRWRASPSSPANGRHSWLSRDSRPATSRAGRACCSTPESAWCGTPPSCGRRSTCTLCTIPPKAAWPPACGSSPALPASGCACRPMRCRCCRKAACSAIPSDSIPSAPSPPAPCWPPCRPIRRPRRCAPAPPKASRAPTSAGWLPPPTACSCVRPRRRAAPAGFPARRDRQAVRGVGRRVRQGQAVVDCHARFPCPALGPFL